MDFSAERCVRGAGVVPTPPTRSRSPGWAWRYTLESWLADIPTSVWIGGFLALYMAWAIGANDVANAMGTSVGSGALDLRGAIIIAGIFEFSGAFFMGGHVTDTVRKGMLDMTEVLAQPELLRYGMLAALAAAATLLVAATFFGLPVSTTHAIVGAIVGFGVVAFGFGCVVWSKVLQIVFSWITSPLIGGALAFGTFHVIRKLILDSDRPMAQARRYGPVFFFYVFFIVGLVTLFKGLRNLKLDFDLPQALGLSVCVGLVGAALGFAFVRRIRSSPEGNSNLEQQFRDVERVFVLLQILTACALCFAHGSNDVANAIGPLAAAVSTTASAAVATKAEVAPWMLAVGGLGIVVGLGTWGYRVIETVGSRITDLTPSRGFAAALAAATTIVLCSRLGIPVSTTHILVGAVLGVGLARGISALDLRVVGRILISWLATLPLAAGLAIAFFYLFRWLLSA
jgi:PiT family inorganic phosphate transporter